VDFDEILYCDNGIKSHLDHSKMVVCLSMCPSLITFDRLVDFHDIWYGGNDIQDDLDSILFKPIASIILKILSLKVVR
jgi:hypothetical protein